MNQVVEREIFISYESPDENTIYGFLRLRIPNAQQRHVFDELKNCALIRELHVYGNLGCVDQIKVHNTKELGVNYYMMQKQLQCDTDL